MNRLRSMFALKVLLAATLFGSPCMLRAQEAPASPAAHAIATGERSTPEAQSPEKNEQEKDENEAYRHSPMVTKLGGMLGMSSEQSATAFEVTNFVLLALCVLWLLVKLVPGAIRARNSQIQKHLVDARAATAEASARLSSVEGRLSKLDEQISALRSQAEQELAREEGRIKAAAEEERKKILASADQEIAAATLRAQKDLQRFAADLAIEQAARKLVVTAETDRLLVQNFAERLAGDSSKKGQN